MSHTRGQEPGVCSVLSPQGWVPQQPQSGAKGLEGTFSVHVRNPEKLILLSTKESAAAAVVNYLDIQRKAKRTESK